MSKTNKHNLEYYLGLNYPVKIVKEEGGFFAKIEELPGCITQGETLEEAYNNIEEARKLWLETAYEDGYEIQLPSSEQDYSGKFISRVPRYLHKRLAEQSKKEGISLNQYVVSILSQESALRQISSEIRILKADITYLANRQKGSVEYPDITRKSGRKEIWSPEGREKYKA